jgi:hypothetical protein
MASPITTKLIHSGEGRGVRLIIYTSHFVARSHYLHGKHSGSSTHITRKSSTIVF